MALVNDVVLNQAIVRFVADATADEGDRLTLATISRVLQEGKCFVGGAQWRALWVMRLSVIGGETSRDDATRAADAIVSAWRAVRDGA